MHGSVNDIVDILSKIITILATILAGSWAYYRFVRGRTFRPRFTLKVEGRTLRKRTTDYLLLSVKLTNIGLSKIDIEHASARLYLLQADDKKKSVPVRRSYLTTARLFAAHNWFEPGVTVHDEKLISLQSTNGAAISAVCAVTARHKALSFKSLSVVPRNTTVKAEAIIEVDTEFPNGNQ